jgi:hypothetical protein
MLRRYHRVIVKRQYKEGISPQSPGLKAILGRLHRRMGQTIYDIESNDLQIDWSVKLTVDASYALEHLAANFGMSPSKLAHILLDGALIWAADRDSLLDWAEADVYALRRYELDLARRQLDAMRRTWDGQATQNLSEDRGEE